MSSDTYLETVSTFVQELFYETKALVTIFYPVQLVKSADDFDSFLLYAQVKDPDNTARKAEAGLKGSGLAKVFSAARTGAWWLLNQVFKVLLIIKTGVQALFQALAPEKVVASLGSAIQRARERLVCGIVRSPPAIWTVLISTSFLLIRTTELNRTTATNST